MTNSPKTTARSIGQATLQFALVAVPVKLYTSHETGDELHFHMHHDADAGRLKQQYVCVVCGEVVDREHTVRGYEHAKGQHVLFSTAELEALEAVATNVIALEEFVGGDTVDPTYVEKTYYLGPDKGSERAYQLIADALDETGKVGIATYARRGSERVVCVRATEGGGGLVLHELRFAHEVRPFGDIAPTTVKTSNADIKLAKEIIARAAAERFNPGKYRDGVQARMFEMIAAKVEGGEIVAPPVVPAGGVIDLAAALRASLDAPRAAAAPAAAKRTVHRDRGERVRRVAAKSRVAKRTRPATRSAAAR